MPTLIYWVEWIMDAVADCWILWLVLGLLHNLAILVAGYCLIKGYVPAFPNPTQEQVVGFVAIFMVGVYVGSCGKKGD